MVSIKEFFLNMVMKIGKLNMFHMELQIKEYINLRIKVTQHCARSGQTSSADLDTSAHSQQKRAFDSKVRLFLQMHVSLDMICFLFILKIIAVSKSIIFKKMKFRNFQIFDLQYDFQQQIFKKVFAIFRIFQNFRDSLKLFFGRHSTNFHNIFLKSIRMFTVFDPG